MTEPRVVFQTRLTRSQLDRIAARMEQAQMHSRNQWIEQALDWVLEQPLSVVEKRLTVRT